MTEIKNGTKYVRWHVFIWVIGIMITLIGGTFAIARGAEKLAQGNKIDIEVSKVQYENIDKNLIEIKELIKNGRPSS